MRFPAFCAIMVLMSSGTVRAQDRLPEIPADRQTEAQREASKTFLEDRKVPVFGPFVPLLRSPQLMLQAMSMGDYLRYHNTLPQKINEFVILITAREWTQQLEWQIHQPIAVKAGLSPSITEDIAQGRRPQGMDDAEEIAWEFSTQLHHDRKIDDRTWARAVAKFGEQGVIDMAGTNGYYDFLAMTMNAAQTAPDPSKPLLPILPNHD
jgi:4-carboxymuconolactone decarboxylase